MKTSFTNWPNICWTAKPLKVSLHLDHHHVWWNKVTTFEINYSRRRKMVFWTILLWPKYYLNDLHTNSTFSNKPPFFNFSRWLCNATWLQWEKHCFWKLHMISLLRNELEVFLTFSISAMTAASFSISLSPLRIWKKYDFGNRMKRTFQ